MSYADIEFEREKGRAARGEISVFKCDCCGAGICVGDTYFKVGYDRYCEECVEECEAEVDDLPEPDWDSMAGGHDDL